MSEINNGGSAFPIPSIYDGNGCGIQEGSSGMTLRDWFAAQALQTLAFVGMMEHEAERAAKSAYVLADAMLAERSKKDPTP